MFKPVLGIIGGGQLGSLLSMAAKKFDIRTVIFSDSDKAPAKNFADEFIVYIKFEQTCTVATGSNECSIVILINEEWLVCVKFLLFNVN